MGKGITVFLLTLSALFPIVDSLAGSPLFLAMTLDFSPQTRRALAWRVAMNRLVLMVGSYFVGALGANSTRRYGFHITIIVAALIAMTAVAISILLCYGLADQLVRVFGKTGMIVIVRLSSFLLVCTGVQIMWNRISALLSSFMSKPMYVDYT